MRARMLFLAVFLAAAPASAGDVMIHVSHNKLEPTQVKLKPGDSVVFHNLVHMPGGHSIVSDDGELQSPPLAMDGKWSHTFVMPGKYPFHIKEHPGAKATVIVE